MKSLCRCKLGYSFNVEKLAKTVVQDPEISPENSENKELSNC